MVSPKALNSSLDKLSLNSQPSKLSSPSKKKQVVADSWEDEDLSSGDEADHPLSPQQSADYPSAPPPTPISQSTSFPQDTFIHPYTFGNDSIRDARAERAATRPEKTDAVARRLIAGALGVKAPKKTEEQRVYEKAIKEKETKRRNEERAAINKAREEAERAKQAVWSDD